MPRAVCVAMLEGNVHVTWTRHGAHLDVPVSLRDIRRGWARVPWGVRCAVHGSCVAPRTNHCVRIDAWLRRGMVDAFVERCIMPLDRSLMRNFLLPRVVSTGDARKNNTNDTK